MPTLAEVLTSQQSKGGIKSLLDIIEKELVRARISGDISNFIKRIQNIQSVVHPNDFEELKNIDITNENITQRLPELMYKYNQMVYKLQEKGSEISNELMQYVPQFITYGDEGIRALDILSFISQEKLKGLKGQVETYGAGIENITRGLNLQNLLLDISYRQMQIKELAEKNQALDLYYTITGMDEYKKLIEYNIKPFDINQSEKITKDMIGLFDSIENKVAQLNYPNYIKAEIMDKIRKSFSDIKWVSKGSSESKDMSEIGKILDKYAEISTSARAIVVGDPHLEPLFAKRLPSGEIEIEIPAQLTPEDLYKVRARINYIINDLLTTGGQNLGIKNASVVSTEIEKYKDKLKTVNQLLLEYEGIRGKLYSRVGESGKGNKPKK